MSHPSRAGAARPMLGSMRAALLTAGAVLLATVAATVLPSAPALANAPDTTVTVNLAQTGKSPTHAGSGFLYGLSQDGSGPADSLLQPLAPALFRGGGARIAGNGWIGDGYTAGSGFRVRITSALDHTSGAAAWAARSGS